MSTVRQPRKINGLALAVAVLRELPAGPFKQKLFSKLKEKSPWLLKLTESCEFIYSDIARLDQTSLHKALSLIAENDWLIAFKLTPEPLKAKLLEAMTPRKKTAFLQDFSALPRMPKTQVIKVQVKIAGKIHSLLTLGKLSLYSRRVPY